MINCSVIIAIFIWTVAAKDWEPLPDEHYMEYKVNGKRYEYGFDMNKQFSLSTDIQLGKVIINQYFSMSNLLLKIIQLI